MVNISRLVRGDLGGFTNERKWRTRDEAAFFKELAPRCVGGVFSSFNGAFDRLYTGKRVAENQYLWRSIVRS